MNDLKAQKNSRMKGGGRLDLVVTALFWPIAFYILGITQVGFQFFDDHDALEAMRRMRESNFSSALFYFIKTDLMEFNRFRPLFWVLRLTEGLAFGSNFNKVIIFHSLICAATMLATSFAATKIGLSRSAKWIVLIIVSFGPWSSVWWRLGTSEMQSTFFIALALAGLARHSTAMQDTFVLVNCVLAVLLKESFLLTLPGLCLLKIYFEKVSGNSDWPKAIVRSGRTILFVGGFFFLDLAFLKLFVLRNPNSYSANYAPAGLKGLFTSLGPLLLTGYGILLLLLCFAAFFAGRGPGTRCHYRVTPNPLMIALAWLTFVLPQLYLYSQIQIAERYFFPSIFFTAVLIGMAFDLVRDANLNATCRRLSSAAIAAAASTATLVFLLGISRFVFGGGDSISFTFLNPSRLFIIFTAVLLPIGVIFRVTPRGLRIRDPKIYLIALFSVSLLGNLILCGSSAKSFVREGDEAIRFFQAVSQQSSDEDLIIVSGDPAWHYQWLISIQLYLTEVLNRKNVFGAPFYLSPSYAEGDRIAINDYLRRTRIPEIKPFQPKVVITTGDLSRFKNANFPWFNERNFKDVPGLRFTLLIYQGE